MCSLAIKKKKTHDMIWRSTQVVMLKGKIYNNLWAWDPGVENYI